MATRNTPATDFSKLLGMDSLIIKGGKKEKGVEGKTAGYRKALKSRLYDCKWIHYFDTLK